jgi:hypothetical protein
MTTLAHALAPTGPTPGAHDPYTFAYTVTGPRGTGTFTFTGRVLREFEVEMYNRRTHEHFVGVRLVLSAPGSESIVNATASRTPSVSAMAAHATGVEPEHSCSEEFR